MGRLVLRPWCRNAVAILVCPARRSRLIAVLRRGGHDLWSVAGAELVTVFVEDDVADLLRGSSLGTGSAPGVCAAQRLMVKSLACATGVVQEPGSACHRCRVAVLSWGSRLAARAAVRSWARSSSCTRRSMTVARARRCRKPAPQGNPAAPSAAAGTWPKPRSDCSHGAPRADAPASPGSPTLGNRPANAHHCAAARTARHGAARRGPTTARSADPGPNGTPATTPRSARRWPDPPAGPIRAAGAGPASATASARHRSRPRPEDPRRLQYSVGFTLSWDAIAKLDSRTACLAVAPAHAPGGSSHRRSGRHGPSCTPAWRRARIHVAVHATGSGSRR